MNHREASASNAGGNDVEEVISALKCLCHVATEQGLAERLHVTPTAISNWRARGRVPARYTKMLEEGNQSAFIFGVHQWPAEEQAAAILALMRMHRGYLAEIATYTEFLRRGGFVFVNFEQHLAKAHLDLLSTMEEQSLDDPFQCLNLLVFQEFFEGA